MELQSKDVPWFAWPQPLWVRTCAVIGAGIAGCSIAYALAKRGIQVIVLDKQSSVASGASGNPVGVVQPVYSLSPAPPSTLATMGWNCLRMWIDELEADGYNIPHGLGGLFSICSTPELKDKWLRRSRMHPSIEWIDSASMASHHVGYWASEGGFQRDAGWIHPPSMCHALVKASRAELRLNTEVGSVVRTKDVWSIVGVDGKTIEEVDAVIWAHATGAQKVPELSAIPWFSVRGQLAYIEANADSQALRSVLSGAGYCTPAREGFHVLGSTFQRSDPRSELCPQQHQFLLERFISGYPELAESLAVTSAPCQGRVSWRCSSENRMPVVGPVPQLDMYVQHWGQGDVHTRSRSFYMRGLYMSLAHGSRGLVTAPISAEILAHMITGEKACIDAAMWKALHPARYWLRQRKRAQM